MSSPNFFVERVFLGTFHPTPYTIMRILFAVACLSSSVVAFKHIPLTVQRSTPLVSSRKSKTFLAFGPDFLGLGVDAPQLPSTLLSFADQGNNLAGIFFQASLLPYLSFLYFLGFRGNRTPALGQFGFAFLLLFVAATIPSGIVAKTAFGDTLANVDWLHGSAEILLTVTNLLIVSGFRTASVSTSTPLDKVESFQRLVRFCSRLDSFALTSHFSRSRSLPADSKSWQLSVPSACLRCSAQSVQPSGSRTTPPSCLESETYLPPFLNLSRS